MRTLAAIHHNHTHGEFYRVTYRSGPYPYPARADAEARAKHALTEHLPDGFTGRVVDAQPVDVTPEPCPAHELREAPTPDDPTTTLVPHLDVTVAVLVVIRPDYDADIVDVDTLFPDAETITSLDLDWCTPYDPETITDDLP